MKISQVKNIQDILLLLQTKHGLNKKFSESFAQQVKLIMTSENDSDISKEESNAILQWLDAKLFLLLEEVISKDPNLAIVLHPLLMLQMDQGANLRKSLAVRTEEFPLKYEIQTSAKIPNDPCEIKKEDKIYHLVLIRDLEKLSQRSVEDFLPVVALAINNVHHNWKKYQYEDRFSLVRLFLQWWNKEERHAARAAYLTHTRQHAFLSCLINAISTVHLSENKVDVIKVWADYKFNIEHVYNPIQYALKESLFPESSACRAVLNNSFTDKDINIHNLEIDFNHYGDVKKVAVEKIKSTLETPAPSPFPRPMASSKSKYPSFLPKIEVPAEKQKKMEQVHQQLKRLAKEIDAILERPDVNNRSHFASSWNHQQFYAAGNYEPYSSEISPHYRQFRQSFTAADVVLFNELDEKIKQRNEILNKNQDLIKEMNDFHWKATLAEESVRQADEEELLAESARSSEGAALYDLITKGPQK